MFTVLTATFQRYTGRNTLQLCFMCFFCLYVFIMALLYICVNGYYWRNALGLTKINYYFEIFLLKVPARLDEVGLVILRVLRNVKQLQCRGPASLHWWNPGLSPPPLLVIVNGGYQSGEFSGILSWLEDGRHRELKRNFNLKYLFKIRGYNLKARWPSGTSPGGSIIDVRD